MDIEDVCIENIIPSLLHIVDRHCDSNWNIPPLNYQMHNFMFIISGEGTAITDGKKQPVYPGMLFYHHPNQIFGFENSKEHPMHLFGVNFQVAEVYFDEGKWSVKDICRLPFERIYMLPDRDILIKYFEKLTLVWNEKYSNHELKLRSIFLGILYEIAKQTHILQSDTKILQCIENTQSYIRKQFNRNLSLNSLANISGYNPNYFGEVFKKYTGKTPIEFVNSVRVEKAAELLCIGYSVTAASSAVGFSDPFYFSKVFKKFKGVSPKDYKKSPSKFSLYI